MRIGIHQITSASNKVQLLLTQELAIDCKVTVKINAHLPHYHRILATTLGILTK